MNLPLAETSSGTPGGAALHAAAMAEIAAHLGPAHAALFARPADAAGRTTWTAPGEEVRPFADLPGTDRRALLAAAGSIVSDIRRLVESGRAPATAAAWPAMRGVPGPEALFAVDGRPVLAPWGRPGTPDLLGPHDDGVAWRAPPRAPWRPFGAALLAVALLALAGGLLLPAWAPGAQPPPAMCQVDGAQMDLMRRQAAADSRGEDLKKLLAATNDDIGRQQLLCPIPQAEAAIRPPPVPAPPPAPSPPRAELPANRWNERDLSMLDGCWHNSTQLNMRREEDGLVRSVQDWKMCFNHGGYGRQSIRLTDGSSCDGGISAGFGRENRLLITDETKCTGPNVLLRAGRFECTRISDDEADCIRTTTDGPATGQQSHGRFRR